METADQIGTMQQSILRMGAMVETALRKTLAAIELQDFELAAEVVREDARIDRLQDTVEDQCTRIIVATRPAAADLRQLLVGIKLAASLERTGDHARHLAHRARAVTDLRYVDALPLIRRMAEIDISMLHDSLTAFVERDEQKARITAARDDQIDRLNAELYKLLVSIMQQHPQTIENGMDLMLVNRFLERLGDHVTNICEWIVFAACAEHVELNK
ncbi:MAG: phosphate transport system regulatory protein PhoU [Spirochaetaceae bacterium]|nr:MAG: phosphate transport system regulatory protein PhoU [Spirochaetaceae bacterium]